MSFRPPCEPASVYTPLHDENGSLMMSADGPKPMGALPIEATIEHKPNFAHVSVKLTDGEIIGDAGSMLWMNAADGALTLDTNCYLGGPCAGQCRTAAGESMCMNKYSGTGIVAFGMELPGDIFPFICSPDKGWVLTKGGFICGTPNLVVSGAWKGLQAFCCSGEGGLLTHVTCTDDNPNLFYGGGFGAIQGHQVSQGKTLLVNTGLFFASTDDIPINVKLPGTCCDAQCNGEGWVMRFTGPCLIFTQNRDPDAFMRLLKPLPAKQADGADEKGEDGAASEE